MGGAAGARWGLPGHHPCLWLPAKILGCHQGTSSVGIRPHTNGRLLAIRMQHAHQLLCQRWPEALSRAWHGCLPTLLCCCCCSPPCMRSCTLGSPRADLVLLMGTHAPQTHAVGNKSAWRVARCRLPVSQCHAQEGDVSVRWRMGAHACSCRFLSGWRPRIIVIASTQSAWAVDGWYTDRAGPVRRP